MSNSLKEERIDWPNNAKMALSIVVNVGEGSEMTVTCGDRDTMPGKPIAIVPYQIAQHLAKVDPV